MQDTLRTCRWMGTVWYVPYLMNDLIALVCIEVQGRREPFISPRDLTIYVRNAHAHTHARTHTLQKNARAHTNAHTNAHANAHAYRLV